MPAQVEGLEPDIANNKLLTVRVKRRLVYRNAIVFQHVQKCCLACVVQTEEENLRIFVV